MLGYRAFGLGFWQMTAREFVDAHEGLITRRRNESRLRRAQCPFLRPLCEEGEDEQ